MRQPIPFPRWRSLPHQWTGYASHAIVPSVSVLPLVFKTSPALSYCSYSRRLCGITDICVVKRKRTRCRGRNFGFHPYFKCCGSSLSSMSVCGLHNCPGIVFSLKFTGSSFLLLVYRNEVSIFNSVLNSVNIC